MKKFYLSYIYFLQNSIPQQVYEGMLSVFLAGTIVIIAMKGVKSSYRYIAFLLFIEYTFLIYCSTVIFRPKSDEAVYNFKLFWSYTECLSSGIGILRPDIIMNILVFIPAGLLFSIAFGKIKCGHAILVGCLISSSIELLQFFLHKGVSEFDDVLHNTLGFAIGYYIVNYCKKIR